MIIYVHLECKSEERFKECMERGYSKDDVFLLGLKEAYRQVMFVQAHEVMEKAREVCYGG